MFETHRMLGEQREEELLRDAQRLHAGRAVKSGSVLPRRGSRLASAFRNSTVGLLLRLGGSSTRSAKKPPRSQLDP